MVSEADEYYERNVVRPEWSATRCMSSLFAVHDFSSPPTVPPPEITQMKRFALATAIMFVAACGAKEETPAVDSAAPAMAPAPAMDSAMMMDSTMKHDSAADTTKKM